MTRTDRWDAIVVGAGIVGAACARALAMDGLRVLVLEGGFTGGGATAAAMGHLVAMDDSPAQLALTALSLQLWRAISSELPPAVEHDACGTLWIAEDEAQMAMVLEKQRTYMEAGIACDQVGAARLKALEPNLRSGLAGALLVPGDGVIYPPTAAAWLLAQAVARGCIVREAAHVDEVSEQSVRCGESWLHAHVIVNAAGGRATTLTPSLPIVPRKGHLAITDRYPGFVRHQLVELGYLTSAHEMTSESVAFNVQPRSTGQVLIGSSRELAGWDAATNRRVLREMLHRAQLFMPALAETSIVRTWTGFRPATADKLPLIGRWTPTPGLWIAAGHEGLGITTSLGTAQLVADMVMGRTPAIDASVFAPDRAMPAADVAA